MTRINTSKRGALPARVLLIFGFSGIVLTDWTPGWVVRLDELLIDASSRQALVGAPKCWAVSLDVLLVFALSRMARVGLTQSWSFSTQKLLSIAPVRVILISLPKFWIRGIHEVLIFAPAMGLIDVGMRGLCARNKLFEFTSPWFLSPNFALDRLILIDEILVVALVSMLIANQDRSRTLAVNQLLVIASVRVLILNER